MLVKIPGGITHDEFILVRDHLADFLRGIKTFNDEKDPLWVSCRLNETGKPAPCPVFVGWVESRTGMERRKAKGNFPDPGHFRFGDTHNSTLYRECLDEPEKLILRNWGKDRADATSKECGTRFYNENHRRSIAIKAKIGSEILPVGTLNSAFGEEPSARVNGLMQKWAKADSEFVEFIQKTFELNGYYPLSKRKRSNRRSKVRPRQLRERDRNAGKR